MDRLPLHRTIKISKPYDKDVRSIDKYSFFFVEVGLKADEVVHRAHAEEAHPSQKWWMAYPWQNQSPWW